MQGDGFEHRRRTAYESAPNTFVRFATTFGLAIDPEMHGRLRALFSASECVDRHFDCPCTNQQALAQAIPSFLEEHTTDKQELPVEMQRVLRTLVERVLNTDNSQEFIDCVRGVLQRGILMHTTADEHAYLKASEVEGELAGKMIALTIGSDQQIWRCFLRDLMVSVTILDKICDANHDHACGEISFKPTTQFYRQAWTIFARRIWHAFLMYPNKFYACRRLLKLLNWYRRTE